MARVALVVAATAAYPAADPEVVVDRLLPRTRTVILHLLMGTTGFWVLEHSCPWGYTFAFDLAMLPPPCSIAGFQEHPVQRLCRFLRPSSVFFRLLPM